MSKLNWKGRAHPRTMDAQDAKRRSLPRFHPVLESAQGLWRRRHRAAAASPTGCTGSLPGQRRPLQLGVAPQDAGLGRWSPRFVDARRERGSRASAEVRQGRSPPIP
jgi:hypothetical protein